MFKKVCLLLALALLLGAFFAGCGGSGNSGGGNEGGGDETAKFVCGVTLYEPMNFKDSAGNWTGFDTEFALLVGDIMGMEVEFQEIEWSQKYTELASGAIDAIWNGFTANASESDGTPRVELVDMSYAYMNNQQCVVVKVENAASYTSEDDLNGKIIAVEAGSAGDSYVSENIENAGEVVGAPAQINTFLEVKSGAADCAVVDFLLANRLAGSGDYAGLVIADIELDAEVYAVGFRKGDSLRDEVNGVMEQLYNDGTLENLAEKYGLENYLILTENY